MSKPKITMKLLVDRNKNKVVFAEAGKECVDFLLHMLTLPLGTVVEYLNKTSMVGSLGNLYGSFESLGTDYVQWGLNKDCLLSPKPAAGSASNYVPLLTINPAPCDPSAKTFYHCSSMLNNHSYSNNHAYVSDAAGANRPQCRQQMNRKLSYVAPPAVNLNGPGEGGYVKGVVTYMIMDDLSVQPISTISSITLLNKLRIQDVGRLEEKEVSLDMKLGLALLKASLMSKTVLTDVFLVEKAAGFPLRF